MDRLSPSWRPTGPLFRYHPLIGLPVVTLPIFAYLITQAWLPRFLSSGQARLPTLPSPRKRILVSNTEDEIPYPPDALPGARDVDSPYGNIRVYEWGPTTGRKVLLIHGISTPCIAFASLAQQLVDRGCRVMLFDLFGRGYSDTPDPRVYRQDMGLWTAQIMTVLTSSELNWTGSGERFTLVGYSMGGGIGVSFTSYFPHLVESLILIAPGGLLRHNRIATTSKLLYSGLLPSSLVEFFVRRRLQPTPPSPTSAPPDQRNRQTKTIPDAAEAEVPSSPPSHPAHGEDSPAAPFPDRPSISIADAVSWQISTHSGFLSAFISSIKDAPVSDEHERWRIVGRRCNETRSQASSSQPMQPSSSQPSSTEGREAGLNENKVLILLGRTDSVILADEIESDATAALGVENVKVVRLEGGHDVPVVNASGCCEEIVAFWGGESMV